jgi:endonuclease YncB( thermonuclease family)
MEVSGAAVIVDGDTLWVGSQEIRIHGIDAPATSQKMPAPDRPGFSCPVTPSEK